MPKTKPNKTIDPAKIQAKDLMQTDVLTLRPDDTVESAIAALEEYHVSGAPVVDDSGRTLGVLSASDIARREHVEGGRLSVDRGAASYDDEDDDEVYDGEDYSPEVLGRARIQDWMSPGFVSVAPDATLVSICRTMMEESIHRVFVVDDGKLRGVVSTTDLVRLIAEA